MFTVKGTRPINLDTIKEAVAQAAGLSTQSLSERAQFKEHRNARVAYYRIARLYTGKSTPQIARAVNRTHPAVVHCTKGSPNDRQRKIIERAISALGVSATQELLA